MSILVDLNQFVKRKAKHHFEIMGSEKAHDTLVVVFKCRKCPAYMTIDRRTWFDALVGKGKLFIQAETDIGEDWMRCTGG